MCFSARYVNLYIPRIYIISFLTYSLYVLIILNAVSLLDPCKCDLVAQWRLISLLLYTRYYFTFVASFCVKVKCVLAALTHRQCTDSNFVMEERVKSSLLLYTILLLYYCPSRLALDVQAVICKARSTGAPHLMQNSLLRISLLWFFKKIHKFSLCKFGGYFVSLVQFSGQK